MNLHELTLEFVSYDGSYPNLCSGTLVFKVGNGEYRWDRALSSGGHISHDGSWGDIETASGPWSVSFPEDFPTILRPAVTEMVNENVQYGCCGGCI